MLADDFVLKHKVAFKEKSWDRSPVSSSVLSSKKSLGNKTWTPSDDRAYFYCKASGHLIKNCPVVKKKSSPKSCWFDFR